jgi:hypothetical protein
MASTTAKVALLRRSVLAATAAEVQRVEGDLGDDRR